MPEGPELRSSRDRLRSLLIEPYKFSDSDPEFLNNAGGYFKPFRNLDGSEPKHFGGRYTSKAPSGFLEFNRLIDRDGWVRVSDVDVKGKFMWWALSFGKLSEPTWWMHVTYGMSGRWERYSEAIRNTDDKHVTAYFRYSRNSSISHTDGKLVFTDPRHFGTLKFINDKKVHDAKLASLGPDMLGDPPDDALFKERLLKRPTKTLAEVLMDQKIVSGVGNYIKAEALYRAKLSPHRTPDSLTAEDFALLRSSVVDVMQESYAAKGATIRTYATVDGKAGAAQFAFNVYGRAKDPEGRDVVKEETRDGRTTHWVPTVQV